MKRFFTITYAKAAWLVVMLAVLVLNFTCFSPSLCPESPGYLEVAAQFVLTFPVGFVASGLVMLANAPLPEAVYDLIIWLVLFITGW